MMNLLFNNGLLIVYGKTFNQKDVVFPITYNNKPIVTFGIIHSRSQYGYDAVINEPTTTGFTYYDSWPQLGQMYIAIGI